MVIRLNRLIRLPSAVCIYVTLRSSKFSMKHHLLTYSTFLFFLRYVSATIFSRGLDGKVKDQGQVIFVIFGSYCCRVQKIPKINPPRSNFTSSEKARYVQKSNRVPLKSTLVKIL